MHRSSYEHMEELAREYLPAAAGGTVVDIGSQDINGSYRSIFESRGWHYTGVDAAGGCNVDVVAPDPYRYPLASGSADLVISGQAFEHVEYFWLSWLEIVRLTRPGGRIFLIAPSRGPEHRHPVDCWRFYADGFRALARWGEVELLHVSTDTEPHADPESAVWGDTVGVFAATTRLSWRRALLARAMRALMGGSG